MRSIIMLIILFAQTASVAQSLPNSESCLDLADDASLIANGFAKTIEGDGFALWPDGDLVSEIAYFKGKCDRKDKCVIKLAFANFKMINTKLFVIERHDFKEPEDFLIYFYSALFGDEHYAVLSHNFKTGKYEFYVISDGSKVRKEINECMKLN